MENKLNRKIKRRKEWIKNLTEYEKSIFVNMLNEAAMKKKRWVTKKEKREVRNRFVDVVLAIREVNKINKKKENVLSEQTTISEMSIVSSDVQERSFLNDLVSEETKVKDLALTKEECRKVLCIAREQIRSQRKADEIKKERDKERHSVEFVWNRPEHHRR